MNNLKLLTNNIVEPDINLVTSLYNRYHSKKSQSNSIKGGGLYKGADGSITITLPSELCWEWSNSAGGNSGGKNPRPVGIRLLPSQVQEKYGDNTNALKVIFSSVDSLKDFIMSSDRLGKVKLQELLKKKKMKKQLEEAKVNKIDNHSIILKLLKLAEANNDSELAKLVIKQMYQLKIMEGKC